MALLALDHRLMILRVLSSAELESVRLYSVIIFLKKIKTNHKCVAAAIYFTLSLISCKALVSMAKNRC